MDFTTIYVVYYDYPQTPEELGANRALLGGFQTIEGAINFVNERSESIGRSPVSKSSSPEDELDDLWEPPSGTELPSISETLEWVSEGEVLYAEGRDGTYAIERLELYP